MRACGDAGGGPGLGMREGGLGQNAQPIAESGVIVIPDPLIHGRGQARLNLTRSSRETEKLPAVLCSSAALREIPQFRAAAAREAWPERRGVCQAAESRQGP